MSKYYRISVWHCPNCEKEYNEPELLDGVISTYDKGILISRRHTNSCPTCHMLDLDFRCYTFYCDNCHCELHNQNNYHEHPNEAHKLWTCPRCNKEVKIHGATKELLQC